MRNFDPTERSSGLQFRTILVPHDFTPESDEALERAADLALASAGAVHLLHVLPYPTDTLLAHRTPFIWADAALLDTRAAVTARLLALGARSRVPVEAHVTIGTPAAQICETAEHIGADLIVMGTHVRRGLGGRFQGSIAARTVRRARCPVLALQGPSRDARGVPPERTLN